MGGTITDLDIEISESLSDKKRGKYFRRSGNYTRKFFTSVNKPILTACYLLIVSPMVAGLDGYANNDAGLSHNNPYNPPDAVYGNMTGEFFEHRDLGYHQGDTGKAQIMFTADALHHAAPGEIFISGSGDQSFTDGSMNLNQLHQRMADDVTAMHEANIIKKTKEKEIKRLEAEIAAEKSEQKREEISRLKHLDSVAEVNEHKAPEVLGKKVIPVVSFTQETLPLRHHVRYILKMIDAVQATENAAIDAQKQVARLDDITDQMASDNLLFTDAKRYQAFKNAAGIEETVPMEVPVLGINGEFYVAPQKGPPIHDSSSAMPNPPAFDGHTHFEDHGRVGEVDPPLTPQSFLPPMDPPPPLLPPVFQPPKRPNFPELLNYSPTIDDINYGLTEGEEFAKMKSDFIRKMSRKR